MAGLSVAARAVLWAAALLAAPATPPVAASGEARFVVTPEILVSDLAPFGAVVPGFGAGARLSPEDGGFEPTVFRNRLTAAEDSLDRVIAAPGEVSVHHTLRSGALDGAEVHVYRVEKGVLSRIRRDRVAPGGFVAEGWVGATPGGELVAPEAARFVFAFPPWHRPGAPAWFAVRSVAADGLESAPSAAVAAAAPERPARIAVDNVFVKRPRRAEAEGVAPPPAPEGLTARRLADGVVVLSWRPVPGVVGYVVERTETAPETHRGYFLALEGSGEPIRRGDLVIVSKKFYEASRRRMHTDRVWDAGGETWLLRPRIVDLWSDEAPEPTWRLVPHGPGAAVDEPGETYLELSIGPRQTVEIGNHNHGGPDQEWYEVLETRPYRVEAWLRADRPAVARFALRGGPYGRAFRPLEFRVDERWRKIEAEFTPPREALGGEPGKMVLSFSGPAVFDVDNFRIWPADTAFLDYTPEEYARLAASGMGFLRTHGFIKTGNSTYDLDQFTNPGGVTSDAGGRNTLPQALTVIERAGVDPWLQIEPHFSPEEWAGLIEYLAAPFDPAVHDPASRPYAAKRHAQGRARPWTDAFDRILIELGNETWNGIFRPWVFPSMPDAATGRTHSPGAVYGMATEAMLAAMRSSPYWAEAGLDRKVEVVIGGWRSQPGYGREAAAAAPGASLLTVAAYNGGWDEDEGPPDGSPQSFFTVLNQATQSAAPSAETLAAEARALSARRAVPLAFGTYEAGPGYVMNGLNGATVTPEQAAAQERVMKSQAAGVATLDAFLAQAERGYSVQSFFTFKEGDRWSSHAPRRRGGAAYPSWDLLALFNREGLGDMLRVETIAAPVADLPATRRYEAVADAPQVAAYAARRGDRLTLALLSRRLPDYPEPGDDGFTAVEALLPIASAGSLTLYRMAGPHDAHNVDRPEVAIERIALEPPADPSRFRPDERLGADARGLPPASALIYVFEGVRFRD